MDGGDISRFERRWYMRGDNDIVDKPEHDFKGRVTEMFEEPFLPPIWTRGGPSISFAQ
jgi:hypothetical protein